MSMRMGRRECLENGNNEMCGVDDEYRYAEMTKEFKNTISHRYKALQKLKAWLAENHPSA